MSLQRACLVCEAFFELDDAELTRLEKEGLAVPSRCGECTARGERFGGMSIAFARAKEERR